MKISKIASATIIGAMMTINVYGSSSLDEINSAQKEKSDLIKKLEEASKNEFLEKFKKEKEKIEQQKEKAKNARLEAEQQKEKAENARLEAENARLEAEQQKEQADQKVEKLFTKENIKKLNDKINNIESGNILKDIVKQTTKQDTKNITEEKINRFKEMIFEDKELEKLYNITGDIDNLGSSGSSNASQNVEKIKILENLSKIGIIKQELYLKYHKQFQEANSNHDDIKKINTDNKKLAEDFQKIIGKNNDEGLRKLYKIIRDIGRDNLVSELENINVAQKELKNKENALQQKQEEITEQTKKIEAQQQKIVEQEQLEQQAQEKLEQAEQKLKEAKELAEKAKKPEVKAKIIAELDEKLDQAKKERAEAISSDKNLELNKD
ncbi:hypothetical protein, partial [Campylobacter pinnipediorum]|uniref:hypothetical protein n=1 Tax=Campylobacter pinnipediorum TaxID=1965231 RepID=UPI00112F8F80